eukprot:SAG31_NODE_18914_length_618_cov_1.134875_2_plen_76_part_01
MFSDRDSDSSSDAGAGSSCGSGCDSGSDSSWGVLALAVEVIVGNGLGVESVDTLMDWSCWAVELPLPYLPPVRCSK